MRKTGRKAKPSAAPVDIRETYRDTLKRFPLTMALLASLTGCATTRYAQSYCVSRKQYEALKSQQPPKVHDQLTGNADRDSQILAGSLIRVRAYSDGLLTILGGCVEK